ncbi:hypothetical protein MTO96_021008 [Rhipicephalus appendiculatus]
MRSNCSRPAVQQRWRHQSARAGARRCCAGVRGRRGGGCGSVEFIAERRPRVGRGRQVDGEGGSLRCLCSGDDKGLSRAARARRYDRVETKRVILHPKWEAPVWIGASKPHEATQARLPAPYDLGPPPPPSP